MTTISISLAETEVVQLTQKARELGYDSVDSLVQKTVQRLLETEDERKKRLMHYIVDKNAELYRRLA